MSHVYFVYLAHFCGRRANINAPNNGVGRRLVQYIVYDTLYIYNSPRIIRAGLSNFWEAVRVTDGEKYEIIDFSL